MSSVPVDDRPGLAVVARASVRRLAAILLAASICGILIGGVGGRLAMLLLARLNPEVTGQLSDDGFVMGRFGVVETLNLLVAGLFLGVVGGLVYAVVRGLMIGPRWFQVGCVGVGAGVVVAAAIVHRDGVDFVLLQPAWLAILLFVLIPGLYAVCLTLLAERWLAAGSWFDRLPSVIGLTPLLFLLFVLPVVPLLIFGWLVVQAVRMSPIGVSALEHPATSWVGRIGLALVFAVGLQDLLADAFVLV